MKRILFILFFSFSLIASGQKILVDQNGKVITNAAGKIFHQEIDSNNYEYTPNAEWIPVNGVKNNEIWILAFDGTGDRYSSFKCTVANSGTYNMQIYGGYNGTQLLSTYGATASGTQINFQIPTGTGKYCSSGGYYTYKIRVYATVSTNSILTFTATSHPTPAVTSNNWKIINFGTKGITAIQCALYGLTPFPYLLYINTYYCENINSTYCFAYTPIVKVTMPKTMNYVTYLGWAQTSNQGEGAFAGCTSLPNITFPKEMNSLIYMGSRVPSGNFQSYASLFYNDVALTSVTLPNSLPALQYFEDGDGYGTFVGCTNLIYVHGATYTPVLARMSGAYNNCTALTHIDQSTKYSTNSILYSSTGLKNMVTYQQDSLRVSSFKLTGTSAANRSNITSILINWSKSNFTGNIDIRYNSLSTTEIVRIFRALPTTVLGLTINVASNVGAPSLTAGQILIATGKGWTVVTS